MKHSGMIIKSALVILLITVSVFLILNYLGKPKLKDTTPEISAPLLSGKTVTLNQYKGKPLLVYFWSTWCPTCKYESPAVQALAADHQVLTVCVYSGTNRQVQEHMDKEGYTFDVINDQNNEVRRTFHVKALPTTFVLDGDGKVVFSEVGMTTGLGLRLRMKLAE